MLLIPVEILAVLVYISTRQKGAEVVFQRFMIAYHIEGSSKEGESEVLDFPKQCQIIHFL